VRAQLHHAGSSRGYYISPAGLLAPHFCGDVKFALVANPQHPQATTKLEELLKLVGDAELEEATAKLLGREGKPLPELSGDLLLTLGGDGTLLYALSKLDLAVFGINIGQVGFLTESEFGDTLETDLERLKAGDFKVEKLQRLEVRLNGLSVGQALNEAVIHTAHVAKIQKFRISLDGQVADEFRADGVIVATPTGSTSYAMSAGSPILHPAVGAHVLVPIAPYRIGSRPLVIPDSMELGIRLLNPRQSVIVLDGREEMAVGPDDKITIVKSATPARFARFGDSFFERVQRKLRMQ
jgi:NAD+ kinase